MWEKIYQSEIDRVGGLEKYYSIRIKNKRPFIKKLKENIDSKSNILEAGCGTGCVTTYLAKEVEGNVIGIDSNSGMLRIANEIGKKIGEDRAPSFINFSLFELDRNWKENSFDLCYNRGVLEHYSDDEIILGLKQMIFVSKKVVVSFPTKYFSSSDGKGDERYLSISHWKRLIEFSGGEIEEYFFHHREVLYKRIFKFNKYFKPKPYLVIVIKKLDNNNKKIDDAKHQI
jgi:ubiquinone/menaquinone biosynthesis C-methylase UbiE